MSDKTAERPDPREDGSYSEPMWPGRWFDADDERLFKLDRDSKGRWFVEGGGVITITERDRWYPCVVTGLDAEAEAEGERKDGTADEYFDAICKAHDLLSEAGIKYVVSEGGWSLHERLKLVAALASERDAALARAEAAERERDEARAEVEKWKVSASVSNRRVKQLATKLAALRSAPPERESSASRPVLPPAPPHTSWEKLRTLADDIQDEGRALHNEESIEVAAAFNALLSWAESAFSSPPPETVTGEAEREGPKTLSREEFEERCRAMLLVSFDSGFGLGCLVADFCPNGGAL